MTHDQAQALESFSAGLRPGARVLYAPGESASFPEELDTPRWLENRGFAVEILDPGKDLRFASLKRETVDGIWCGRGLSSFPIEEAQRVVAAFFQALRPGTGILFVAHRYPPDAFASMARQNGFRPRLRGTQNKDGQTWSALLLQRI